MREVAKLPVKDRTELFQATAIKMGMLPNVVEKDFWVCFMLDHLFHDCQYKKAFVFKGGTSLSKSYHVIERFSEDIDLILDWRKIITDEGNPWSERSKTKQDQFNKQINAEAAKFYENEFVPKLNKELEKKLGDGEWVAVDSEDEMVVNFYYPQIFESEYLRSCVRLEIGPLAEWMPSHETVVSPFAAEKYPDVFTQKETSVLTIDVERTFWEKLTILHKIANFPEGKVLPARYARHLYDVYNLGNSWVKESAFARKELLEKDVAFKQKFYYTTIMNGDLNQVKQECFEENNVRMGFDIDSDEARSFVEDVRLGDIILSFKTRKTIDGIAIVTDEAAVLQDKSMYKTARAVKWLAKNIDEDITDINNGKLLHRMTFAKVPNMNVKDVIKLAEKVNPGLESTVIEENTEPHVFIIDEINRGNISKIFGELITLIESTKRAGMSESASAILPYSGDEFSVPSNVYILGTMNTADRSIALMDTALRRRFQFIEMMPDSDVLRKIHADKVEDLDVAAMLDKINERITFLYDREHTIGHAFFTGLKDDASLSKLQSIFEKSVIPLLQEYFYEDYQKIQLVLGDNAKSDDNLKFILDEKVVAKNIFKGNVEDVIDLPEKRYSINKVAFGNINSYKEIL